MKRIHIVGLCLVAAFAFSAIAVSSASAGTYGVCYALSKSSTPKIKHGKYKDANCRELSEKKGKVNEKGAFEFVAGAPANCVAQKKGEYNDAACAEKASKAHKGHFERRACYPGCANQISSTGPAELSTAAGSIKCTASTDTGVITGPKSDEDIVTFTNCESGGAKCTTKGQPEGTIKTENNVTTLIDHGEKGLSGLEPKAGEAWVQFSAKAPSKFLATFTCVGVAFVEVEGSVSGVIGPLNTMALSSNENFEAGVGEQDLKSTFCTNESCTTILAKELPGTQKAKGTTTSPEETEIKG